MSKNVAGIKLMTRDPRIIVWRFCRTHTANNEPACDKNTIRTWSRKKRSLL